MKSHLLTAIIIELIASKPNIGPKISYNWIWITAETLSKII